MPASNPDVRVWVMKSEPCKASRRERAAMGAGFCRTDNSVCGFLSDRLAKTLPRRTNSATQATAQLPENAALATATKSTRQFLPSRIGRNSLKTIIRALGYSTIFSVPCDAQFFAPRSHSQDLKLLRGLRSNDVRFRLLPVEPGRPEARTARKRVPRRKGLPGRRLVEPGR